MTRKQWAEFIAQLPPKKRANLFKFLDGDDDKFKDHKKRNQAKEDFFNCFMRGC